MKKEDIPFLEQLLKSIEDSATKLEEANRKKDYEEFRKTKRFMVEMQQKIKGMVA